MTCKAIDILNFAESLIETSEETAAEAAVRSSISRAYYAAYHTAKLYDPYLPVILNNENRGGTHKQLIDRFSDKNADTKLRAIGYILRDMCTQRESADYNLDETMVSIQASTQILAAKRVITKLEEFAASQVQEQA